MRSPGPRVSGAKSGGLRIAPDGLRATLGVQAQVGWRSAFGGRRSGEIPIDVSLAWVSARWQVADCAVAGEPRGLR